MFTELASPKQLAIGAQDIEKHGAIYHAYDPASVYLELANKGYARKVEGQWRLTTAGLHYIGINKIVRV